MVVFGDIVTIREQIAALTNPSPGSTPQTGGHGQVEGSLSCGD